MSEFYIQVLTRPAHFQNNCKKGSGGSRITYIYVQKLFVSSQMQSLFCFAIRGLGRVIESLPTGITRISYKSFPPPNLAPLIPETSRCWERQIPPRISCVPVQAQTSRLYRHSSTLVSLCLSRQSHSPL